MRRIFCLALCCVGLVAQAPLSAAQKSTLADFATRFWKARPKTAFDAWDPAVRQALWAEAVKFGPVPDGALGETVEILFKPAAKFGPRIENDAKPRITTPYGEAKLIVKGQGGKKKGLVVGLHGGGEGAGDMGEPAGTWRLPNCMGMYPQGIKLVHDTWNTVHGEKFILTLIEIAKTQYGIDPDRVYVMGFSMGGTGSWFMAGRHPDLFAGAAPCAGVVMAQPKSQLWKKEEVQAVAHGLVPNIRNLAMWSFIGTKDANCMPGTFLFVADMLADLKKADPEGYGLWNFKLIPGLAHAMPPGEPQACFKFLEAQKRDAFPKKIVWEYATEPFPQPEAGEPTTRHQKRHFYWLQCAEPRDHQTAVATRDGNAFTLDVDGDRANTKGFSILLTPKMIDPKQDVVVKVGTTEVYRGKPESSLRTVVETLDARCDTTLVFDRRVDL